MTDHAAPTTSRRLRPTKKALLAGGATILLLGGVSGAYAAIPGAGGVISGCYDKSIGNLRVVDASTTSCKNSETAITWNQTGPQGTPGTNGTNGTNGVSGYEVRSYDYTLVSGGGIATMTCPVGKVALGGGYWLKDESAMTAGTTIIRSMPGVMDWSTNTPVPGSNRGWIVQPNKPDNINPGAMTVYVTCATMAVAAN